MLKVPKCCNICWRTSGFVWILGGTGTGVAAVACIGGGAIETGALKLSFSYKYKKVCSRVFDSVMKIKRKLKKFYKQKYLLRRGIRNIQHIITDAKSSPVRDYNHSFVERPYNRGRWFVWTWCCRTLSFFENSVDCQH